MADNFLEFSEVLPHLTAEEEAWLRSQLEIVCVFGDREFPEDQLPGDLDTPDADFYGCRAWRDLPGDYSYDGDPVGFAFEFHDDHAADGWGRHLWFSAEEMASPERVAHLVQNFLKAFRPQECWSLTYATTCSKPRASAFGGGAAFVTADGIKWQNTLDFTEEEREAFLENRQPRQGTEGAVAAGGPLKTPGTPMYELQLDGPLLRRQRQFLLRLREQTADGEDRELLEGLLALTDELADQAHDEYGLDCLLGTESQPCECEKPGYFCSGIPGILAHLDNGRLAAGATVERCDLCQRYPSDEAALAKLRELGHCP